MSICEDYSTAVQVRDRYNVFHHGGEDPKFLGSDPVSGHCYFLLNLISFHTGLPAEVFLRIERQIRIQIHTHTPIYARAQRERESTKSPTRCKSVPCLLELRRLISTCQRVSLRKTPVTSTGKKKRCDLIPTKTLPGVTKGMGWK